MSDLISGSFSVSPQIIPAGRYLLIDPWRVIGDRHIWSKANAWYNRTESPILYIFIDNNTIAIWGVNGDSFSADDGYSFGSCGGICSGFLSLIPLSLVNGEIDYYSSIGLVLTLKKNSKPKFVNGDFICGNIVVVSSPSASEV